MCWCLAASNKGEVVGNLCVGGVNSHDRAGVNKRSISSVDF